VTSQHTESISAIEHVFTAWDNALGAKDVEAAMARYHPDATLESPLVCHLFDSADGVVGGGLIRHHRVYWGWYSVQLLKTGQHPGRVSAG
jgi:hypothetical protein